MRYAELGGCLSQFHDVKEKVAPNGRCGHFSDGIEQQDESKNGFFNYQLDDSTAKKLDRLFLFLSYIVIV